MHLAGPRRIPRTPVPLILGHQPDGLDLAKALARSERVIALPAAASDGGDEDRYMGGASPVSKEGRVIACVD